MIDRKADSFVTLQMTYSISSEKGYTYKEVTPTMKTNLGFDVNTYEAKFGPQNFCSGCAADGTLSYEMTMEMFIDPVVGNVDSFILKNFYDIDFSSSHVSAEW